MAVSAQTTLTVSSMLHFICSSLPKTKSSTTTTTSNKEAHIQRRACLYVLLLRKKHGGLRRAAISEAAEDRRRWGQQQPPPPSTSTTTTSRPRRNCEHSRKDHDDKLNSSRVCCRGQPLLAGSGLPTPAILQLRPRRVLNGMHHEVISLQMAKVWHPHSFPEMTMVFQVLLFGLWCRSSSLRKKGY